MVLEPHGEEGTSTPPPLPARSLLRDHPLYRRQQTGTSRRSETLGKGGQEVGETRSSEGSLSERCTLRKFLMSEADSAASSPTNNFIDASTLSQSSSMYDHCVFNNGGQTGKGEEESEHAVPSPGDYGIETSGSDLRWSGSSSEYHHSIGRSREQPIAENKKSRLDPDLADHYNEEASETNSTISSYDRGRPSSYQHSISYEQDAAKNQPVKSNTTSETDASFDRHYHRLPLPQDSVELDDDARAEAWLARGLLSPKQSGTLSLFPSVSLASGNQEHVASSVPSSPTNSPVSPLNNGRDMYGNWIDSNTTGSPKARPVLQKEQSVPHLRGGWGRMGGFWGGEETGEKKGNTHHLVVAEGADSLPRGRSQTVPHMSRSQTAPDVRPPIVGIPSATFTSRHRPTLELQTGSSIMTERNDAAGVGKRAPGPPQNDDYDNLSAIFNKYFGVASSPTSPTSPATRPPTSPAAPSIRSPAVGNLHGNKYVTSDVEETGGPRSPMRGPDNTPRTTKGPSNAPKSPTIVPPNTSNKRSAQNDQQYSSNHPQALQPLNTPRSTSPEPGSPNRNLNIEARPEKRWDKPLHLAPPARQPPAPPESVKQAHRYPDDDTDKRSIVTQSDIKSIDIANLLPLDKEIYSSGVYISHHARVRAEKQRKERENAKARWLAEREREKAESKRKEDDRRRRLAPLVAHQARQEEQHSIIDTIVSESTTISPSDSVSNRIPYRPPPRRREPPRRDPHPQFMETLHEQDNESPRYGQPSSGFAQRHPATGVHGLSNRLPHPEPDAQNSKPAKENMNSLEMGLHITGKVVRSLLAAPSDPKLKTYSRREPPEDMSPALGPRPVQFSAAAVTRDRGREGNVTTAPPDPTPPRETLWSHISRKKAKGKEGSKPIIKPPFPRIEHTTLSGTTAVNSVVPAHIPLPPTQRYPHTHRTPRRPAPSIGESTIPEPHHTHQHQHQHHLSGNRTPYAASEAPTAWPEADATGDIKVSKQGGGLGLRGGGGGDEEDAEYGNGKGKGQMEVTSRFSTDSSDEEEERRKMVVVGGKGKGMVFVVGGLGWVG